MPVNNVLKNNVPHKTLHKILELTNSWKFVSVRSLKNGSASHMMTNDMNKQSGIIKMTPLKTGKTIACDCRR